jgi:HSP20 family protein
MPGVAKEHVQIKLENDILEIEGKVDVADFSERRPIYSEYNVGNYFRRFAISNKINRDGIEAKIKDGVLTLTLPKAPELEPKRISVA